MCERKERRRWRHPPAFFFALQKKFLKSKNFLGSALFCIVRCFGGQEAEACRRDSCLAGKDLHDAQFLRVMRLCGRTI